MSPVRVAGGARRLVSGVLRQIRGDGALEQVWPPLATGAGPAGSFTAPLPGASVTGVVPIRVAYSGSLVEPAGEYVGANQAPPLADLALWVTRSNATRAVEADGLRVTAVAPGAADVHNNVPGALVHVVGGQPYAVRVRATITAAAARRVHVAIEWLLLGGGADGFGGGSAGPAVSRTALLASGVEGDVDLGQVTAPAGAVRARIILRLADAAAAGESVLFRSLVMTGPTASTTTPPPVVVEPEPVGNIPRVLVQSAADLHASVGGNLHLPYTSSLTVERSSDRDAIVDVARESGLRLFRDEAVFDKDPDHRTYRRHRAIAAFARWDLILGNPQGEAGSPVLGQWATMWNALRDPRKYAGLVNFLEGPNENTRYADVRAQMIEVARILEASSDPLAARLRKELWSPSFAFSAQGKTYGRDPVATRGVMHSYPGGRSPVALTGDAGGFFDWLGTAYGHVPGVPVAATETGFHDAWKGTGHGSIQPEFGHVPTNEEGYTIMAPRLIFDYARQGVGFTILYQLQDVYLETALIDREAHFGLVRYDGTFKPQGLAVKRTMDRLADAQTPARQIGFSVSGAGVWHHPRARSDGSMDLALWQPRDATKYEGAGKITLLSVPTLPATVRFEQRMRLESFYPSDGSTVVSLGVVEAGVPKTLMVPHHTLMLRATPV